MTSQDAVDLWRLVVGGLAGWMACLVLWLGYQRWLARKRRKIGDSRTHPLVYLSYAIALLDLVLYRVDRLGTPANAHLLIATAVVALGIAGITRRVRFTITPPWRRDAGWGARRDALRDTRR